jgi:hypothetical protein
MASEEDINNQSRFNDLQRDSNELLADYQAGIRESTEFVSILTTRTSQLVDSIKDTVGEKKKSTQADKDLISSITKINNLTKDFATPYTDAGKAIRDTNKATELHERLVKDVGVIANKLGEDRLKQAKEYLEAEKELGSIERTLAAERRTMTTQDQKSADKIVEAQRNKIEAERQYNKFVETSGINVQSLYAKMGAIKKLEEDQEVKRRRYEAALKTGTEKQIKTAQEEYKRSKARVTLYEDGLTTVEKTALARQRAKQQAQEQYKDEFKAGSEAAKRYALHQENADVQRDILEEKQKELDTDQKLYVEGEKALKQSETGVDYLKEENKRVRQIVGAQTLWNLSLGAAGGILKKIGLDNQVIVLGLDEGTKAAKEYAAELVAGRQKARGEAALAQQASEDAAKALENAEQQLTDAKLNGSATQIQAAQKEYDERKNLAEQAKMDAIDAEDASRKANSLVTKVGDSFRVLGKGISATFKGMASELKALGGIGIAIALTKKLAKAIFSAFGGNIITKFVSDLVGKFKEGISYLKDQFFSLQSYIDDAKVGDQLRQQLSQAVADLATGLGVSTKNAKELTTQASKIGRSLGMLPEELAAGIGELNKAFGTTQKFSDDTVKTFGQLTKLYGLTNEEASEFVKLSQLSGQEASDTTLTYKTQIQALKERNNIAISEKEVMAEIAKSSAAQQLTLRASGKSLAEAAFHAKKMGLSLAQTEAIGSNLLDFESSIANEMEAELLLGKDLNLERARSAALQGDLATVAKEVAGQIGSAAEFGKMNVIQQEALAKSVGVSRDELANMLKTQELLAGTGFDDMNDAQAKFKELLKETGSEEAALAKMKEMGASDALQDQMREISLQEKRAQQERDIADAQLAMATAVNKVFDAFYRVEGIIKNIKAVIVEQMKPFFDAFGGLVGEGGKAFEKEVLPYAERLGKFMNGVGLRLVDIVKNSGPALKNIFQGVLKLFGSIYKVVGGVIERLLGVEKTGTDAGSVFESIANFLSSMVDKLENVDIDALTEKIKKVYQDIKDGFNSIKEGIKKAIDFFKNSQLGKLLSGDGAAISLAIAPVAIKGFKIGKDVKDGLTGLRDLFKGKKGESKKNPLYVENVGGSGGSDLMNNLMRSGGRQAGIGGGFKKGWKGLFDYAKMSLKGGRAGKVGRARLLRAGKGLLTGQGASFVGGTGPGSAQAAGRLAGGVGKIANIGKTLGQLAKGGVVFAAAGMAAEAAFSHFAKKSRKAASAMDDQIMVMEEGQAKEDAIQAQKDKLLKAESLAAAGTVASYTAIGAGIGSMIPVVGTAVGAVVGFTAGVVKAGFDYEKNQKWINSTAFRAQKERLRNMKKTQVAQDKFALAAAKMRLEATKKAAALEIEEKKKFAEKLGGVGTTFESIQNLDIDNTSEAFKELAIDALNAGNVTEEQFIGALKGTISPLEFMNAAAVGAGNKLKNLTESALSAAKALGDEAKAKALADAGVDEDVVNAQLNVLKTFTDQSGRISAELLTKYSDDLSSYINTTASEALAGTDSDSAAFRAELQEKLKATGATAEEIATAMSQASEIFAGPAMEDVDISTSEGMNKLLEVVTQQIEYGITDDVTAATAKGAQTTLDATRLQSESGLVDAIAGVTKEQLTEDKKLQEGLKDLGMDLTEVLADGITTEEYTAAMDNLTRELSEAGLEDKAKFDQVLGMLKANQKSDLIDKANAAKAAGNTVGYETLIAQAQQLDDFILRPGEPPLKFNKDDLIMGGTKLMDSMGVGNPIEAAMSAFGKITSSLSPEEKISPIFEKLGEFKDSLFGEEEEKKEVETQSTEDLKVELQEMKQIMASFVQQMNQVVNRPIVVEMNGNKVGQALGQDSYRIQ